MKGTELYLAKFEERLATGLAPEPAWVRALRQAGIARFAELGFPTVQQEDWRFTNVAPIAKLPFKPVFEARDGLTAEVLKGLPFARLKSHRLVFINGHFSPELSAVLAHTPAGVKLGSIADALHAEPVVEEHLGRSMGEQDGPFGALNNAFFTDGAFIHVPKGVALADPVQLIFIAAARENGAAIQPHNLIIAEPDSRLTVIETYVGVAEAATFTNAVTELIARDRAVIEHCKVQAESAAAFHMAGIHMHLGAHCDFISHSIALGARLSRNNLRTRLAGEGVDCVLNGLYLTGGEQLADHHMIVEHARPNCNSHEYYNGILADRSKAVFHGRILVRPEAQKTDAKQTNKNLLLSDAATVDTKPQLEIYADDVKCTHGATVGQLSADAIFYLRARGIGLSMARRILIHAFASEIIDRIRFGPVREELGSLVWERLEQNPLVTESK